MTRSSATTYYLEECINGRWQPDCGRPTGLNDETQFLGRKSSATTCGRIVSGDEIWVLYVNHTRHRHWPSHDKLTSKQIKKRRRSKRELPILLKVAFSENALLQGKNWHWVPFCWDYKDSPIARFSAIRKFRCVYEVKELRNESLHTQRSQVDRDVKREL